MQSVAQSWLVYRLTGSGLASRTWLAFASQFPVLLLAPVEEAWLTDSAGIASCAGNPGGRPCSCAVCSRLLTLAGLVKIWHVFVLAGALHRGGQRV